jgi:hypothetical protein
MSSGLSDSIKTNLSPSQSTSTSKRPTKSDRSSLSLSYTFDLSSISLPYISVSDPCSYLTGSGRGRGTKLLQSGKILLSYSTFINIFLLWTIISLGIQVQRLRNEVAFVAEETRDLRYYGFGEGSRSDKQHDRSRWAGRSYSQEQTQAQAQARRRGRNEAEEQGAGADANVGGDASLDVEARRSAIENTSASSLSAEETQHVEVGREIEDSTLLQSEESSTHQNQDQHQHHRTPYTHESSISIETLSPLSTPKQISTSLGRVVFGSTGWEQWATHPT